MVIAPLEAVNVLDDGSKTSALARALVAVDLPPVISTFPLERSVATCS